MTETAAAACAVSTPCVAVGSTLATDADLGLAAVVTYSVVQVAPSSAASAVTVNAATGEVLFGA